MLNLRIGKISDFFALGYSHCHKCLTNWGFVEGHTTRVTEGSGCFPLCERCWEGLTPEERLPYYRQLYDEWLADGCKPRYPWSKLKTAVLNERN